METWKPVIDYEGHYIVSNLGNVKSIKKQPKNMKIFLDKKGYERLTLSKNGKVKQVFVHTLVARAFIGEVKDGYSINHIDGNTVNNSLMNLEIVTHKENIMHSLYVLGKGVKPVLMLDPKTYEVLREFPSVAIASRTVGINDSCIFRVCNLERNFAGGYSWSFKESFKNNLSDDKKERLSKNTFRRKRVKQINLVTGETIKIFESVKKAKTETKINNISNCATGRIKHAGGYGWKYEVSE